MITMLKYWRLWLPIVLTIAAIVAVNMWAEDERQEARDELSAKISEETAKQVQEDEQAIYDAYLRDGTINTYVDRMLSAEPEETDSSDRLQRPSESTKAPE